MSEQVIIFKQESGGVGVIYPAPGVDIKDCIGHVPHGQPFKIVSASEIPTDRTFRDAWVWED